VLAANTAEFTEATPVQKKKVAKKTPRPAKRKETR
jgi:hypothetical protein